MFQLFGNLNVLLPYVFAVNELRSVSECLEMSLNAKFRLLKI